MAHAGPGETKGIAANAAERARVAPPFPRPALFLSKLARRALGRLEQRGRLPLKFLRNAFFLTLVPIFVLTLLPFVLVFLEQTPASAARAHAESARPADGPPPEAPTRWEEACAPLDPRRDAALQIVQRVSAGLYTARGEIASGRFLTDFDAQSMRLQHVDKGELRLFQYGPNWVVAESEYRPPTGERRLARLRMVVENGAWKLEDLSILRGRKL